jgi:hypothetical protein
MNATQIDELFQKAIQIKGIQKKANVTKQVIYNYRNRPTLALGDKIEFLLKLGYIKITANHEPTPEP